MSSKILALIVTASLCPLYACSRAKSPEVDTGPAPVPNVVLITVDTLRADRLGCYGYEPARTPNIDRLAIDGVRVDHAIASAPLTLPSHTSILTGLLPPAHGVRDNGTYRVPDAAETLAERLRADGYQTQAFVSAEVLDRRFNLNQGFDGYDDDLWNEDRAQEFMFRERSGERTMDRVIGWLSARSSKTAARTPFFVWIHLFDPHDPYRPPETDAKLSPTPYDGEIASVDRQIGRLVDTLKSANVLDDTILVFTSDHGESLGEHGEGTHSIFVYESTVRVPLIFRYPRKLPSGKVYRGPARSIDIMPTVLALAEKGRSETQGTDLSGALAGASAMPSLVQYSESLHPSLAFGMAPLEAIRVDDWTYIRAPHPELYDRRADPRELNNLLEAETSDSVRARAIQLDAQLSDVIEDGKRFGLVAEERPLDPQTIQMLKALGYMGDSDAAQNLGGMDPKDGVQIFDLMTKAIVRAQSNDCPAAVKLFRAILKQLPGHVEARNILAGCEAQMGNNKAAQEDYLKSLAHDPQQVEVFLQLGRIDLAQGRIESARRRFSEALEIFPDSVEAMMLMGYLEFTEGDPTKATRWYGRAIAVDPKRPDAYLQQGDLYFRKRRFDDALIWYEKAASVAPENFAAALQAGLCALSLDDRNTAERYFVQANEADPSRWQPLYSLACVRAQQQDSDAALGYLEAAVGKGFRNASRMRSDPCILSLAGEPRFIDLMRTMGHSGAD